MATKVHMEALSPTMEEGQVVKWFKSEGDEVSAGEVLAEIETDKATMELTARGEGVLRKILVQEGGTAPVGEVIAVIAAEDEEIDDLVGDGRKPAAEEEDEPSPEEEDEPSPEEEDEPSPEEEDSKAAKSRAAKDRAEEADVEEDAEEGQEEAGPEKAARAKAGEGKEPGARGTGRKGEPDGTRAPSKDDGKEGRVKASPLARRLAGEAGLELSAVVGSGPGGRIVKRDIEEALQEREAAPAARAAEEDYEEVPLSQMRKAIARRLVESLGPVPHFFLTVDLDMGRALEARRRINALLERDGDKISINDLIIRATAAALRRHPDCNVHWGGDHVRRFNRVHVGVAVAVDDGLITPVVRDAERKGVAEISREVREMAGRARDKKLKPEEYTGATFSVSNLGMFGIHEFTAVINPPEGGILAVGAVEERPVVVEGQVVVRPRMRVTMSCDHRTIDGAQGSRFLATLKAMLEEPAAILA